MKALAATGYGQPEQLTIADLPVPEPGPGQIRVRIAAAPINPTDIRAVAGLFPVPLEFPYVLGTEFAGTVTALGAGVTAYQKGDEVFGQALPYALRAAVGDAPNPSLSTGTLAEYAVFEAATPKITHRPANVLADVAAVLPISGGTALALMNVAKVQPGESVLVIGATGGVGATVIPLLADTGATVIATARTAEGTDFLLKAGADRVVGYDAYPSGVDVVLNLVLFADGLPTAARALRPGGRLVSIVWPAPELSQTGRDDIDLHFIFDMDGTQGLLEAAAAGTLTVPIARRYTIDEATEAAIHYARQSPLGKIVVTFP
ncbi:NADP-dependent oxidoreductase [Winogradskya consettensis]|uniref:NADPH:quinone reductase n=1 Tax=Winogradskya consettensis TaxID=113560 RepID=A0A919T352_9ACTN|nr:NADP-dependent oxidoreductase [Actinoplanes consettensis]GIM83212.1 NADPH:quinone reductase [Actinoplanes consettensis]